MPGYRVSAVENPIDGAANMTATAPLIITDDVLTDLARLRVDAAAKPVDVTTLARRLETPAGRREHHRQMDIQTVVIGGGPFPFFVTFSVETGHPVGTCRHMSMSIRRQGRVPHPAAVWMVAEILGFAGGLGACRVWPEDLSDRGKAVNIAQPIAVSGERRDG